MSALHWVPRAVKKAGLTRYTWHGLRHTLASRLVMGGVDILTAAKLMGHGSLAMTMRYSHLSRGHQQVAMERLNRYNFLGRKLLGEAISTESSTKELAGQLIGRVAISTTLAPANVCTLETVEKPG
jgi:hypothetical protein